MVRYGEVLSLETWLLEQDAVPFGPEGRSPSPVGLLCDWRDAGGTGRGNRGPKPHVDHPAPTHGSPSAVRKLDSLEGELTKALEGRASPEMEEEELLTGTRRGRLSGGP